MTVREKEFSEKKPDQLVYVELGNANGGMLLSISEDGFRFRAVTPVRGNGNIPFAFSLDGKVRLEGSGAVEWTEDDGKSGGMRFTEVSPEFRTTLADWLSGKSSHNSSRREPSPAEADRRDTMEAIQQELRAGYPQRPAKKAPQLNVPEQKPAKHKFQEQKFPEQKSEPRLPYRISEPVTLERKPDSLLGARKSETAEPNTAHKLFPLQPPPPAESEKPASSVFLKRAAEAKAPAEIPATSTPPPTQPRFFQPVPATDPKKSLAMHAHAGAQQRPYIPALEDSFQNAWDQARLSAPQDSPHLTRAAAGSIVAIALAVILGALIYNFRQDIGATFIQLGQSISGGDNHSAASAPPQQAKTDTAATEQQNTNQKPAEQELRQGTAPADSGSAENPGSATNPDTNPSTTSPTANDGHSAAGVNANNPPVNDKNRTPAPASSQNGSQNPPQTVSPNQAPPVGSPSASAGRAAANPPLPIPQEAIGKNATGLETGSGEEEFKAAQDLLRGSNRRRDLPVAVSLLWSGVRKGYVPAEVALADLFRRGEGVQRNCDQARILLVAASKKGSFDARMMLERMAEQGCE